ncbi:MAG: tetratricopeptide repeat protein, partial [Candidatus Avigastranaerophilus sp.]
YEEALKICNELIKIQPDINIFMYVKGIIYLALNDIEKAIEYMEKAKRRGHNINIESILKEKPSILPELFDCMYYDKLEKQ